MRSIFRSHARTVITMCKILMFSVSARIRLLPGAGQRRLDWTQRVRIAGYGLKPDNADAIVQGCRRLPRLRDRDRQRSQRAAMTAFWIRQSKLEAIRRVAERAHAAGQKAFVYTAALECITGKRRQEAAHVLQGPSGLGAAQDHRASRPCSPAARRSGSLKGDEDVWISPYAPEWRRSTCRGSARSRPPASTASTWTSLIG